MSVCFPRKSLHFPGKSFFFVNAGGIGEEDADPARNEDQRRAERRARADLSFEEGQRRQVQPQERERQAFRGRRRDFARVFLSQNRLQRICGKCSLFC